MSSSNHYKRLVPVDILFSSDRLGPDAGKLAKFRDVPIGVLHPVIAAIENFKAGQPPPPDFAELMVGPNASESDRQMLADRLKRALSPLSNLLRPVLPTIRSLDRDRLVLADGHIESCVAKLKGDAWIKVRMDATVAAAWDARPRAALDRIIQSQGRTAIYTPIMHADFRKLKVSRPGTRRLDLIRGFLGPVHRPLSVLDIGCNTGFYTFHLYRQGFQVTGIDMDEEHLAVARALATMYSAPVTLEKIRMQDFAPERPFDIALGMSVFWHMLGWGDFEPSITPEALCSKLDELVGRALFWEGGKRGEDEIDLIRQNSALRHYTRLGRTHATGIQDREFGVFTREPPDALQAYLGSVEGDQPIADA